MPLHRALFALPLCLALPPFGTAAAETCAQPSWLKVVELRRSAGEIAGTGKGANVDAARRDARRSAAKKLVERHFEGLLALPSLKNVNRKVYTPADLAQAMAWAIAYNIRDAKRLQSEAACGVVYAAISIKEKAVLALARKQPDLGDQMNAALTGKMDELEDKRTAEEALATGQELATPEATALRLTKLAAALAPDELLEAQMQDALRRKAAELKDQSDTARTSQWPDQRAKAVQVAGDLAIAGEKFAAAAREVHRRDFVAAFEILNALASSGDAVAQFAVGYMQAQALGVRRDYKEALVWLKRSAAQNYGPAKMLIGVLIFSGRGAKPDPAAAFKWIDSAAGDGWSCQAELTMCRRGG